MTIEPFNFWNERKASDVESLLLAISEISNEEFSLYTNGKNDFASWIEYSLQNADLASRIKSLSERDLIKAVLADFIEKEKGKLLIGVSKSSDNDTLAKEVMKRNEEFLGTKTQEEQVDPAKVEPVNQKENIKENVSQNESKDSTNKGSTIAFASAPNMSKLTPDSIFFVGLIFGIMIGVLATLIVLKLMAS